MRCGMARMMVQAELQKLYPKENKYSKLLFVSGNYCYQKSYEDVAKELIKNELHKNMVHDLISHLKERTQNSIFVSSKSCIPVFMGMIISMVV